ncbi:apolipoprotein N-acyltransferase [Rippkaea orientalis PCC 8801]|uniref:Apolipoprotein N-acyltransferase n=1 Tax=Rippkaea orientalis (strain PCC 8801 / RF-1) TaxID=41431 RepID=B7K4G9_RIPO1|nr:apolipoprotein N-acyltransferase [Rippkaea orientalis]ACK65434.1 apolipoprotein N-acyltransferase [Rippkaea orientalis PCC 8801]
MGLSTAPVAAFYLAWLALIPLWFFTFKTENPQKITLKSLIFNNQTLIALAWGLGYHGLALFWITGIHPMTWMGVPWLASLLIAIFCWLFITFWGAILVSLWSIIVRLFDSIKSHNVYFKHPLIKSCSRILWGVAIWCLLESIWSQSPLWWTSLSYTQSPDNLAILQLSKLSGFSLVTAAIVMVNGLIAESFILSKENRQSIKQSLGLILSAIIFVASLHIIGFNHYNNPLIDSEKDQIKVGIIQGNIPNTIKLYPGGLQKAIEGYTKGYKILANEGVDLIITPETALPFDWHYIVTNTSIYPEILTQKVPIILGAFGTKNSSYTNSLFMVTAEGELLNRFDKIKLVPLGEYIPFQSVLGKIINRLSPLDTHLAAGNTNQIFRTPFGQAIVGICYESAFSEHFRRQTKQGGEFIITASNNAHYSAAMPAQHHAQDIIRAIESDRWMARATNTGYSAIINPHGQTLWISNLNTYELHQGSIYRRQTQTLYVQWGDWLTKVLVILSIILLGVKVQLGQY